YVKSTTQTVGIGPGARKHQFYHAVATTGRHKIVVIHTRTGKGGTRKIVVTTSTIVFNKRKGIARDNGQCKCYYTIATRRWENIDVSACCGQYLIIEHIAAAIANAVRNITYNIRGKIKQYRYGAIATQARLKGMSEITSSHQRVITEWISCTLANCNLYSIKAILLYG